MFTVDPDKLGESADNGSLIADPWPPGSRTVAAVSWPGARK